MNKRMLIILLVAVLSFSLTSAQAQPSAYMTFVLNVHDWVHSASSADIIPRLIDLFESHGIRGDFYLTADVTRYYVEQYPEIIERLCHSEMTISYHVRPPHPLYNGFERELRDLSGQALYDAIYAAETQRLDLTTGELIADESGGYQYVAQTCGRNPVAFGLPQRERAFREAAMQVYTDMGAQMIVLEHETGAELQRADALWTRPSDFSVTRWPTPDNPEESFWWDMLDTDLAAAYNPVAYLQAQLADWQSSRPPFITTIIHEQNFYYRDGSPWDIIYYAVTDNGERRALKPPFDITAVSTVGQMRSDDDATRVWEAYVALVEYVAEHPEIQVVTSADIVTMQS